jgi:hypothetical protein
MARKADSPRFAQLLPDGTLVAEFALSGRVQNPLIAMRKLSDHRRLSFVSHISQR